VNAIDVRDLIDQPGSSRRVTVREPVADLRLELASVPADAPIEAELLLESVIDGILASGPVAGRMAVSCARCLKSFEHGFDLEVRELFAPGAGAEGEEYPLAPDGSLDPEPMIRDAVLLSVPFSPLCRSDCLGLCERCGGDRNLGECTCGPDAPDPRWAALETMIFDESGKG
jgi:DUF177 domain-containing protein